MDVTLSQSRGTMTDRPGSAGRATPRGRIHSLGGPLLTILIGLAMIACDRVDADVDSSSTADSSDSSDRAETSASFAWPDDPNHPLLTVEVAGNHGGGKITIELMPELAPNTVAHVIDLAQQRYYDGTTFHRVIPGFMIQGGDPNSRDRDPNNDGQGNLKLSIDDEFGAAPFVRGVVGMGNKGRRNSTGGQFFIMHADNHNLDGRYTVIGRVTMGMDVVDAIMGVEIDRIGRWGPKDRPIENVVMTRVEIAAPEIFEANRVQTEDRQKVASEDDPTTNALADL